jgi:hypothetical protein
MKRLFLLLCLLCSFSAYALTDQEWNKRFAELNNIPFDSRATQSYLQSYNRVLINQRPDFFKNPDNYPNLTPPITPVVPSVPAVIPVQGSAAKDLIDNIRRELDALEKLK